MVDIVSLLVCLHPEVSYTRLRQLSRIAGAILAMSGRVTMLGISRWTGKGGSYRTVQRFFSRIIPWATVFWLFFRRHLFNSNDVYLLGGDECVVTKSGKQTHGLDRFFSSLYGKPVPGLCFFTLSLISVKARRSFPIRVEQVVKSETEKAETRNKSPKPKATAPKRQRGRPKGSKNKDKTQVSLTEELQRIKRMVQELLLRIAGWLPLTYLVLDGHFGNHNALEMTRQCGLHLISKLRSDAALYFCYEGPYAGRGPRKKYGDKLNARCIPPQYQKQVTVEKGIQTRIYQARVRHKEFAQPLNVVVIQKTHLATQRLAHVLLFSSDWTLAYDQLIDFYSLRFQLEFNFRDAKQYWGLEDFMNITQTAVTNAANLSLFMVLLSYRLLGDFRRTDPCCSVLDLKAYCRGARYIQEIMKWLPGKLDPLVLQQLRNHIASLGRIHPTQAQLHPS